jgi:hypothetical protein
MSNAATLTKAIEQIARPLPPKGPKIKRSSPPLPPPVTDDPMRELRRLTKQHVNWMRKKVAMLSMVSSKVHRHDEPWRVGDVVYQNGDVIPTDVPEDVIGDVERACETWDGAIRLLEREMTRELRKIPIYTEWLKNVYGVGDSVIAAYLIGEIDIRAAERMGGSTKVSNIRRFCGLAVFDGRLERRSKGQKNKYNAQLRTRLYQFFTGMRKNTSRFTVCDKHAAVRLKTSDPVFKEFREATLNCKACQKTEFPNGVTTKYLDIWNDYKHRMAHSARVDVEANTIDGKKGAKKKIDSTGWHKAADVFIEDLYIVWRALEGLPVWPSYQAAKLGYEHGGKICVTEPRLLTFEQAIEIVGDVGARPAGRCQLIEETKHE